MSAYLPANEVVVELVQLAGNYVGAGAVLGLIGWALGYGFGLVVDLVRKGV